MARLPTPHLDSPVLRRVVVFGFVGASVAALAVGFGVGGDSVSLVGTVAVALAVLCGVVSSLLAAKLLLSVFEP